MSLSINYAIQPKTSTLFDPETGIISPRFKHQLDLVGITVKRHFPQYSPDHILNVNEELQTNGCFQKDCDLYKKGGTSPIADKLTSRYEQTIAFLEDVYADRENIMPREKRIANAIFPCGVEATMHKRFNSLQESLKAGFQYDAIHFIVKDAQAKEEVLKLINGEYNNVIKAMKVNIVVAETELNIFEKGLKMLSESPDLGDEYVIITDPTFASKVEMTASSMLPNKKCLGIASVAIKDWKVDMNLYGYTAALGSHERATIAWAASQWNFSARQVNTEMRAYKTTHVS